MCVCVCVCLCVCVCVCVYTAAAGPPCPGQHPGAKHAVLYNRCGDFLVGRSTQHTWKS